MGSKPVPRGSHVPLNSNYYTGLWESCEAERYPVLCHIGDVEDFWTPEMTPDWAKNRGWGYWNGDYPKLGELYEEIAEVLGGYPKLKITLCHMLFMTPNLERLDGFLGDYPNVSLDLAPGIELLYNISRRREEWRDFFRKHDSRILFGTDIGMSLNQTEHLARIHLLRRFLESGDEFYTPPEADQYLTRYSEPFIGLSLPPRSLRKIYADNFKSLWGSEPAPLDAAKASLVYRRQGYIEAAKALEQMT